MTVEVNEHGRELDATCSCCDNAITSDEAAEYDGECFVCFEEDEDRRAEQVAVHGDDPPWGPSDPSTPPWAPPGCTA